MHGLQKDHSLGLVFHSFDREIKIFSHGVTDESFSFRLRNGRPDWSARRVFSSSTILREEKSAFEIVTVGSDWDRFSPGLKERFLMSHRVVRLGFCGFLSLVGLGRVRYVVRRPLARGPPFIGYGSSWRRRRFGAAQSAPRVHWKGTKGGRPRAPRVAQWLV